jgi:hypothetical protein
MLMNQNSSENLNVGRYPNGEIGSVDQLASVVRRLDPHPEVRWICLWKNIVGGQLTERLERQKANPTMKDKEKPSGFNYVD